MRRVRDWLLTVPFLIAFGVTLLVFDLAGRLVRPISLRGFENAMAALQRTLVALLAICGARVKVERSPNIERGRGYVLISNHQSLFDIALIGGLLASNYPKFVAKKELSRWIPSVSLNLRRGGNALIDRSERIGSIRAIKDMARRAQERDVSVVIFPEGSRSRDGKLRQFRPAGTKALLATADKLAVVPVAIDGSWRLVVRNLLPVPFGTKIRVKFGEPIQRSKGDASTITQTANRWIGRTLTEWRTSASST